MKAGNKLLRLISNYPATTYAIVLSVGGICYYIANGQWESALGMSGITAIWWLIILIAIKYKP